MVLYGHQMSVPIFFSLSVRLCAQLLSFFFLCIIYQTVSLSIFLSESETKYANTIKKMACNSIVFGDEKFDWFTVCYVHDHNVTNGNLDFVCDLVSIILSS